MFVAVEGEHEQMNEALNFGAIEYVVKPFSPAQLKNKLQSAFNKSVSKKNS